MKLALSSKIDLQKTSTQITHHPQAKISVDHQELASMEYNIKPPKNSQNNESDAKPSTAEIRDTIPKKKGHIDHQMKEFLR